MKKTLWTKDFTLITAGTVISAIGGTAMGFALSLVVFDNTSSTWLTGVYAAVMMIPSTVLPVISAPFVDSHCRQKMITWLDAVNGLVYFAFAAYIWFYGFSYVMYMLFGLATGCISTVYQQAYGSLYPELIPVGFTQKGYSVSSLIYPTAMTVITPIAALVYTTWGIEYIFIAEGVLLLIAASFERFITPDRMDGREKKRFSLKAYCSEMLGGIRYLKNEKGVRNIYTYMTTSIACGNGNYLMSVAYFQSGTRGFTTAMFSFLQSAETLGRMAGGLVHYIVKIPPKVRYRITVWVYTIYNIVDGTILLLAYPVMVVLKFIVGFLGVNSMTLREAAVQKRLPSEVRARVEALFMVMISLGEMATGLIAGAMGELLDYPIVSVIFGVVGLMCVYLLVVRNRKAIKEVYEVENP